MPAGPGEKLLTTLFADVHYYFNDNRSPSQPAHHRFDRQSYVYLYHNVAQSQAKLEIANHAGTPDQDAFSGFLSLATVQHSHLQPSLVTLSINSSAVQDHSTWHLPSFNERNEQKYLYKIYALDMYFWTERDAATFLGHLKNVMGAEKVHTKEATDSNSAHAEHRDTMSPVVQQLEKTAIAAQFPPRTGSTTSSISLAGPPTPAFSTASPQSTPVAYNPAAPAAPEPVTYREKTPPPPDDGTGTGLMAAAKYDTVPPAAQYGPTPGMYSGSQQSLPQFSGPPSAVRHPSSGSIPGPPSKQPSFGPMAASTIPTSPPPGQQHFQRQPSFGPTATQYAGYPQQSHQQSFTNQPGTPGYHSNLPPTPSAPPPYSGGGIPPPPPPQTGENEVAPAGGYSAYSYSGAQGSVGTNIHGGYTGDVHGQAYQPTEAEYKSHKPARHNTNSSAERNKLDDGVKKLEGKVGKYLNKLDKLF